MLVFASATWGEIFEKIAAEPWDSLDSFLVFMLLYILFGR